MLVADYEIAKSSYARKYSMKSICSVTYVTVIHCAVPDTGFGTGAGVVMQMNQTRYFLALCEERNLPVPLNAAECSDVA